MTETQQDRSCGYVAVIGAPNAGKSTLVNQLVGSKVSIVSPKVQTTRNRIMGIVIKDQAQVILVDTPGLFTASTRLERAMVSAAWSGADEGDMVAYIFDSKKKGPNENDRKVLERLSQIVKDRPVFLLLNKVDAIAKPKLLELAVMMNNLCPFTATFMISAKTGDGVEDVLKECVQHLPKGIWLYDEDQISDMPMRLLAAELTREQVFLQLHEEVPYEITVETEVWEPFDNGSIRLQQTIHVTRDNLKAIILGKGGSRLREIGTCARVELEKMLDTTVHLKLFVRVTTKWKDDPDYYSEWGLDSGA
ncbi:MAG: GTPase Era [Alphaproteobacteria bacterium]|jgi:GTP-binding protein Era|nr:GTPase Era [Alphaproteobacteria bacterium]MCB1551697.1 GTPase Era [Alphaproteobacteria bacterium]MCB9985705.1 GTPase Era [Micavibrio sp.]HRK97663.1 GTPase Era [Alphaproteobacteria bacterium]